MPSPGHFIGAAKVAAQRIGCSVEHYLEQRAKGLSWCSSCRSWSETVHSNQCRACRKAEWRANHPPRRGPLTDIDVANIRRSTLSIRALAREYRASRHTIRAILAGRKRVKHETKPANDAPPHPPQSWCRCEWCERARGAA